MRNSAVLGLATDDLQTPISATLGREGRRRLWGWNEEDEAMRRWPFIVRGEDRDGIRRKKFVSEPWQDKGSLVVIRMEQTSKRTQCAEGIE